MSCTMDRSECFVAVGSFSAHSRTSVRAFTRRYSMSRVCALSLLRRRVAASIGSTAATEAAAVAAAGTVSCEARHRVGARSEACAQAMMRRSLSVGQSNISSTACRGYVVNENISRRFRNSSHASRWSELRLRDDLSRAMDEMLLPYPTEVQQAAIPRIIGTSIFTSSMIYAVLILSRELTDISYE